MVKSNNTKANDFYDLVDKLSDEHQHFKRILDEYKEEKRIIDEIVKKRKIMKLSQRDLAVLTGIKQPAIARIESMEVIPKISTLRIILDALNLKIDLVDKKS